MWKCSKDRADTIFNSGGKSNALTDMVVGNELREDEEEGARARESMGVPGS